MRSKSDRHDIGTLVRVKGRSGLGARIGRFVGIGLFGGVFIILVPIPHRIGNGLKL